MIIKPLIVTITKTIRSFFAKTTFNRAFTHSITSCLVIVGIITSILYLSTGQSFAGYKSTYNSMSGLPDFVGAQASGDIGIVCASGQVLTTTGSGVWACGTGGGSGSPGGSDTQVQFNDASAFGGDAGFTYNKSIDRIIVSGDVVVPTVVGGNTTTSDLNLKTTVAAGTTGADMHFLVGNNGATEAMTILNSGNIGFGTSSPTANVQLAQSTIGVGDVTNTAAGTTVSGNLTNFLNDFQIGNTITIGGETQTIATIVSAISMTTTAWTNAHTSQPYTLVGGNKFSFYGNGNVDIKGIPYINRALPDISFPNEAHIKMGIEDGGSSGNYGIFSRGTFSDGINYGFNWKLDSRDAAGRGQVNLVSGNVFGTKDLFFQGSPVANSTGYTVYEGYDNIGFIFSNYSFQANRGEMIFAPQRAEGMRLSPTGKVSINTSTNATARLEIAAGTATAGTAPLKLNSGTLLTSAEAGAVEFLTDKYYGTITTGAARKELTLNDAALTSGRVPFATTNGRLTDSSAFTFSAGTLSSTTFAGALTGNASTATALATPRNINGVAFDGTAPITVTAAAGTLTGATLNSGVTASSLTSVGTIATGVWNGTDIAVADGGTGVSSLTAYAPIFGGTTTTGAVQSGTVGTSGQALISNGAGVLPTFQSIAFTGKNLIINGAFNVWQRGTSFTGLTDGNNNAYTADRFKFLEFGTPNGIWTIQKTADGPTIAQAGRYVPECLEMVSTGTESALAITEAFGLTQNIEGENVKFIGSGQTGAKSIRFSFWMKASTTGVYGLSIRNSAANRSYATEVTVSVADTWEFKEVTIAADTTGTWLYDSGIGLSITVAVMSGSNFQTTANTWAAGNFLTTSNQVNLATSGRYMRLAMVQAEVGTTTTGFDERDYRRELALARRYTKVATYYIPGTLAANIAEIDMRATPTITGGGAGFTSTGTTLDNLIAFQTTGATAALTLAAEL